LGTDRYFDDLVAVSPNQQWKLTAISPDNRETGYHVVWQDEFVYSAYRYRGEEPVWTREQEKQEPSEGPPTRITISDDGWAAIGTGWDQLIFVSPAGHNHGRVDDLKSLLKLADIESFGVGSSAGLIWSPYSLWYFAEFERQRLFVIRLWWGNRLVIDPTTGKLLTATARTAKVLRQCETDHAIDLLKEYKTDSKVVQDSVLLGAYLAGALKLKDAVPLLRMLERSESRDIVLRRFGNREAGDIDSFSYRCHYARQVSRLSLRRLGEKTSSWPTYEFMQNCPDKEYFRPGPVARLNDGHFRRVKPGMTPEGVLARIGSPDFVSGDRWEFDVNANSEATYIVKWKEGKVTQTRRIKPRWINGLERDEHIVLLR
jgi:hypothetical protein